MSNLRLEESSMSEQSPDLLKHQTEMVQAQRAIGPRESSKRVNIEEEKLEEESKTASDQIVSGTVTELEGERSKVEATIGQD